MVPIVDLHETGVPDLAGQSEHFRAFGVFRAHRGECFRTVEDNARDVGEGFDVVDHGGFAEQAAVGGVGRSRARHAALAFDAGHQRSFFATDEGTGAFLDDDVEIKAGIQDVFAEQTVCMACSMASSRREMASGYSARI